MRCPFCKTENRDERETCYYCEKDLSMLRLIVNKAKSHFNTALEYAERDRIEEAITELQSALELDSSHVNSHVVLGTLHAKQGRLDEARECWERALRLDPRMEKAHQYLGTLEVGRRNLPVVRRQRLMLIVMAILLVALGVLQTRSLLPDPAVQRLKQAQTAWSQRNDADALRALSALTEDGGVERAVRDQALVLRALIEAEHRTALERTRAFLQMGRIAEANAELVRLLQRRPPETQEIRARELKAQVLQAAQASVAQTLESFQRGEAAEDEAARSLGVYQQVAGGGEDEFLRVSRQALVRLARTRKVEAVVARFKEGRIDELSLLTELAALRADYPDYEALATLIERFGAPIEEKWAREADASLKARRLERSEQAVAALGRVVAAMRPDQAAAVLEPYMRRLTELRAQTRLEAVRTASADRDYEKAVALGSEALESSDLDPTSRAVIETLVARANERLAEQRWRWMKQREQDYINARISVEEAERTIREHEQVKRHLSRRTYPRPEDDLLFYLAMAYRRLGQSEQSARAFQELKEQHTDSPFLRWVRHWEERDRKESGA